MNRSKYLIAIFIGTFVYVALSITVGQNGLKSCRFMENQKRIISKQATDIQNINSELNLELKALQNDNAVIAAYARKLDYVSDGEKLLKINGLKPAQTTLYDIGSVVHHEEPVYLQEKYCKIIAIFFSLLTCLLMILYDAGKGNFKTNKEKNRIVKGIPVYDLPQI